MKMCEYWNTCLLPRIYNCSGRADELGDRCNADPYIEEEDYCKTIEISESDIIGFFGAIPQYPHADGNIFEKEQD